MGVMYLIQLLLPLHDNNRNNFPSSYFTSVRAELTDRFGGVTAFLRSPAIGLWKEDGDEDIGRDEVVLIEVMAEELDKEWWSKYRRQLEETFHQDEVLVWASQISRL